MSGVNTLYNALATTRDRHGQLLEARLLRSRAAWRPRRPSRSAGRKLTGKPIIEGYGLSETSPVVCVNRLDLEDFSGTIGYPVPSTDVSIRSPMGACGAARRARRDSASRVRRSWRAIGSARTRPRGSMTPDGYFRTGDVAVMLPDGQVKIVDRMKDMIIVSGFNVYPNEVEDVLAEHPGVHGGRGDRGAGRAPGRDGRRLRGPKDHLTAEDARAHSAART